jgi:hypothetical protein
MFRSLYEGEIAFLVAHRHDGPVLSSGKYRAIDRRKSRPLGLAVYHVRDLAAVRVAFFMSPRVMRQLLVSLRDLTMPFGRAWRNGDQGAPDSLRTGYGALTAKRWIKAGGLMS